jgi:hypothetical protein
VNGPIPNNVRALYLAMTLLKNNRQPCAIHLLMLLHSFGEMILKLPSQSTFGFLTAWTSIQW